MFFNMKQNAATFSEFVSPHCSVRAAITCLAASIICPRSLPSCCQLNIVEKELESVKKERDQDAIKHERELLELEKRYREEKQAAIDQYQAKYLELLEKMQNQEKSLLTTK